MQGERETLEEVGGRHLVSMETALSESVHILTWDSTLFRVCCRSPIVPVRPTYSAELLSTSFNGSLPRSSGAVGSAPDLSNGNSHGEQRTSSSSGNDSRSSPVTNVWTNPYHDILHHHHQHVQNHHHRTTYDSSRHHAVSGMRCIFVLLRGLTAFMN